MSGWWDDDEEAAPGWRRPSWGAVDVAVAALVVMGVVVALVQLFGWVNTGDATCGAVYRPSVWSLSPYCQQVMRSRVLAAGAAIVGSGLGAYVLVLRTRLRACRGEVG